MSRSACVSYVSDPDYNKLMEAKFLIQKKKISEKKYISIKKLKLLIDKKFYVTNNTISF